MQTQERTNVADRLEGFRERALDILQEWHVPGVGIAVVHDGEVVMCEGLGLKDVANRAPMTERTLLPIGSSSKAFTTMGLAILVDEGKLAWDAPIRTYIPTFQMWDRFATERMTARDLATHRSGLPRHDLAWYNSSRTRRELLESLPFLEPSEDFRTVWQYQNLMYMTAGYLIEVLSGMSWDAFMRERIFTPLGMTRTTTSSLEAQQADDFAKPYTEEDDEAKEIPFYANDGAIAPAGAINSCAADMSRWLLVHLGGGTIDGRPFVSEGQLRDMHAPHMTMLDPGKWPEMPHSSYGLGWFVQPYRGHNHIHHGGNINGFSALVSFLPRDNVGVVVLSNLNGTPVPEILTFNVFDRLLGLDEVPWNERWRKEHDEFKKAQKASTDTSESERVPDTHPSHPLDAYTGDFRHPGYGIISVRRGDDGLVATYNEMHFPLQHYHYDTFELTYTLFHVTFKATFAANARGDIDTVTIPLEPQASAIVFTRVADTRMSERSFLEPFTGTYELMELPMAVALSEGNTLVVSLPGQPDRELEAYKGTEFTLKGLSGFSIRFIQDESGTVTAAQVSQPGATFTAAKKG